MASRAVRTADESATRGQTIVADCAVQQLLDALDDADCRGILDATRDDALTANELSEAEDLPLSTAYRKLELLTEAGLLEERTRIRQSGKHASEYTRVVDDVVISLGTGEETAVRLSPKKATENTSAAPSSRGE